QEKAMSELNETHDPSRRSWLEAANRSDCDFPLQNLPFGVFERLGAKRRDGEAPRGGVAIGDSVLDLRAALAAGFFSGDAATAAQACCGETLNPLMSLPPAIVSSLRARLSNLLRIGGTDSERLRSHASELLVPLRSVRMDLPAQIGAYTDFSCSYTHMGGMRGGEPAPIFFRFPIGYNGRASSIRASGVSVTRPRGQWTAAAPSAGSMSADGDVRFGPEPRLDFELEFAAFVGQGNELGSALSVDEAGQCIFAYCLLNDWSARGIQMLEMGGLGPFLGKSFLTTISPWLVTDEALAPFRTARPVRRASELPVPAHLDGTRDARAGGFDIELMAYLQTAEMRTAGVPAARIVCTNFSHLYWTFAQMLAHHTSNGCNLQSGDLIASGTVSGPEAQGRACLAEINQRGTKPLELPGGQRRVWLEDGDELTIRGRAVRDGYVPIGFGECAGRVTPSRR
ncbi:MAG TPA: fumarylacetoacetase, partial [Steroidobacteraceae bacterium]|nr:fumarylacetoacetase [Steroidobacteraceae bacterium]